jgi:uncharacterized protein YutD
VFEELNSYDYVVAEWGPYWRGLEKEIFLFEGELNSSYDYVVTEWGP